MSAPIPHDEAARLALLQELAILDTAAEPLFDAVCELARGHFEVESVLISLVDANRQWFKARVGLDASETPRSASFCAHALERSEPLVIEDARQDPRFADNPLVTAPPHIRFYAGIPLRPEDGISAVGTLCLLSPSPRPGGLSQSQWRWFEMLATLVQEQLRNRLAQRRLQKLELRLRDDETLLAAMSRTSNAGFGLLDAEFRVRQCNALFTRLLFPGTANAEGQDITGYAPPGDASRLRRNLQAVHRNGIRMTGDISVLDRDGLLRISRVQAERILHHDAYHVFCTATDVTTRRRDETIERLKSALLMGIDVTIEPQLLFAPLGKALRAYRPAAAISVIELVHGKLEAVAGDGFPEKGSAIQAAILDGKDGPVRETLVGGHRISIPALRDCARWPALARAAEATDWQALWSLPLLDEDGDAIGAMVVLSDRPASTGGGDVAFLEEMAAAVSETAERQLFLKTLQEQAVHDPLTGAGNRSYLEDQLPRMLLRAARIRRPAGLLLLDLDNFKGVNDTHGHDAGDALLVECCRRLQGAVREPEHVIRLGGDEFVILLSSCSEKTAAVVARRVLDAFDEPFNVRENLTLQMTPSVGLALSYPGETDPSELLKRADQAMYQAKQAGKGIWRMARPPSRLGAGPDPAEP